MATPTRPVLLSIEGGIGVGKSTVLERLQRDDELASREDVVFIREPVDEWERAGILHDYYHGDLSAGVFQLTVMCTRYRLLEQALRCSRVRVIISERSLESDRSVFAKLLVQAPAESRAYELAHTSLSETLSARCRHRAIHIDLPPDEAVQRVRSRGRAGEARPSLCTHMRTPLLAPRFARLPASPVFWTDGQEDIHVSFLREVHAAYADWLVDLPEPAVCVDAQKPIDAVVSDVRAAVCAELAKLRTARSECAPAQDELPAPVDKY